MRGGDTSRLIAAAIGLSAACLEQRINLVRGLTGLAE